VKVIQRKKTFADSHYQAQKLLKLLSDTSTLSVTVVLTRLSQITPSSQISCLKKVIASTNAYTLSAP
jgi:hypothetical protein